MLVCNVSLRPPRHAIAAELVETSVAVDAIATGNVVFATLVDDPASVAETVDAYLGEIMLEAASADAVADGVLVATYTVGINEVATASDLTDGVKASFITWDTATAANVTLSGGNLVVTNTSTAGETGARGPTAAGKISGKRYFEITLTTEVSAGGGNTGFGFGTTASTYTAMGNNATVGAQVYMDGGCYTNGTFRGALGALSTGHVIGIAVDLDNLKVWFNNLTTASGWNALSLALSNPATNTGGYVVPAGTMVPFCTFGGGGATTGNVFTANFGASAFTGAVPSGFAAGW